MTDNEKAMFTRTLRKMQRKGLIAVALCVVIGASLSIIFRTPLFYGIAAALLGAAALAFYSNFIKLPARVDRVMRALETPGTIKNVQIGVVAANEAVANSAVAQWYVEVQLADETIDLVPGAKSDAEALAQILGKA